jgi:hypothetical protein
MKAFIQLEFRVEAFRVMDVFTMPLGICLKITHEFENGPAYFCILGLEIRIAIVL